MAKVFRFYNGKPETGFCAGCMEIYSIIIRVKFFFVKNDRSIKWWIKNGPDLWDVVQFIIDLLAKMIM